MKYLIRELYRMKWRTIAIILMFALSITAIAMMDNLAESEMETLKNIHQKYSEADIVIYLSGNYNESILSSLNLTNIEGIRAIEFIQMQWGSSVVSSRLVYIALMGIKGKPKVNTIIVNEDIWSKFYGNFGIIDKRVAEILNLSVGSVIDVFLRNRIISVKIGTIADMPWAMSISRPMVLYIVIPVDFLCEKIGLNEVAYNVILVDVYSGYKPNIIANEDIIANEVISTLEQNGISVSSYTVYEMESLEKYAEQYVVLFTILLAPISIVAATFLASILFIKVSNEFRIIGIKKALGYTPRQIFLELVTMGILIFLFSVPVAIIMDFTLTWILAYVIYSRLGESLLEVITIVVSIRGFIKGLLITFVFGLLSTLIPARKASKVNAANAIRYGLEPPRIRIKSKRVYKRVFLAYVLRHLTARKLYGVAMIITVIVGLGLAFSVLNVSISLSEDLKVAEHLYDADILIHFSSFQDRLILREIYSVNGVKVAEPIYFYYIDQEKFVIVGAREQHKLDTFAAVSLIFVDINSSLLKPKIISGHWIRTPNDAIISYRLHLAYGVDINSEIEVGLEDWTKLINITVCGIGIIQETNGKAIIMSLEKAYEFQLLPENKIIEVLVKVENNYKPEKVAKELLDKFGDVISRIDIIAYRPGLEDIINVINAFAFSIILFVIVLIFIGNMSLGVITVLERRYEFGVLKSIGMTSRDIVKICLLEIAIIFAIVIIPILLIAIFLAKILGDSFTLISGLTAYVSFNPTLLTLNAIIIPIVLVVSSIPKFMIASKCEPAKLFRQIL